MTQASGSKRKEFGMTAHDEYLEHLATVPLFSQCNRSQLQEISRVADEVIVRAGTVLTQQGDFDYELFVIIDGTAKVNRDGRQVASIGRGEFVGELAVIAHVPRSATVVADTDLDLLVLTPARLDQLLDDIPGLAKHLLFMVAARLVSSAPEFAA
jgi:CRP/FNR family cyclic AMP-dependent transcriptional regulator